MAGMPHPLNKACKIAFQLIGVPLTLQDDKKVKQYMKSNKADKYKNTQAIDVDLNRESTP